MPIDDSYVDVAARIIAFFAKHPDGSLRRVDLQVMEIEGATYLAYTAAAYRTPDDPSPGEGSAWERVPGLTNFTRNSELQNAETSAWGRAIVAVGAANTKRVATSEDVASRMAEAEAREAEEQAVGGLRSSIIAAIEKLEDSQKAALKEWMASEDLPAVRRMNAGQCDRILDWLMTMPEPVGAEA